MKYGENAVSVDVFLISGKVLIMNAQSVVKKIRINGI